jgi:putative ABC transport system ATP-binding protein
MTNDGERRVLLAATGLERRYGLGATPPALRGVDLRVRDGEWVAVMGPSGCGKSTLLHLLGGLDRPDAGRVVLDGIDLGGLSETARAKLRRRRVGFVFQFANLLPHLDVTANIALPARLIGIGRRPARARSRELLDELGLAQIASAFPSELSGGEQQRVALARALTNRPALVLADEPTGALDTDSARDVIALLRQVHAEGQAIVMVTHDHRVAAATDRVVMMQDGSVIDERVLAGVDNDPSRTTLRHLVELDAW